MLWCCFFVVVKMACKSVNARETWEKLRELNSQIGLPFEVFDEAGIDRKRKEPIPFKPYDPPHARVRPDRFESFEKIFKAIPSKDGRRINEIMDSNGFYK